jgi:hypothetical protein
MPNLHCSFDDKSKESANRLPSISSLFLPSTSLPPMNQLRDSIPKVVVVDSPASAKVVGNQELTRRPSTAFPLLSKGQALGSIHEPSRPVLLVRVYFQQVQEDNLMLVPISAKETLSSFAKTIETIYDTSIQSFSIVDLSRPDKKYDFSSMNPVVSVTFPIFPNSSFLLSLKEEKKPVKYLSSQVVEAQSPQISTSAQRFQDSVRTRLTQTLQNKSMHINLQMISDRVEYSKAALSLWRRDIYKGKTFLISVAVNQVLDDLESQLQTQAKVFDRIRKLKGRYAPY